MSTNQPIFQGPQGHMPRTASMTNRMRRRMGHVIRRASRMWREHGAHNHRAIVGIACAALLAILVLVSKGPLDRALARLDAGSQLVIYLSPFAEDARGQQLAAQLRHRDGVVASEFVGRVETRQRLLQAFRGNEVVIRELDASTLPTSIELRFAPGIAEVMPASPLPAQLRALPEVAELTFIGRDDHTLAPVLAVLRLAGGYVSWFLLGLAMILGMALLHVSTTEIRHEASVIEMLGGPTRIWRLPVILVGGLQGFAGAGFALVIGYWLYRGLCSAMLVAYPALADNVALSYVSWQAAIGLLVAYAGLGVVVALGTVSRAVALQGKAAATSWGEVLSTTAVGSQMYRGTRVAKQEWT